MVLSSLIALYSIAGGIFFFLEGQYFWFTYPGPLPLTLLPGALADLPPACRAPGALPPLRLLSPSSS